MTRSSRHTHPAASWSQIRTVSDEEWELLAPFLSSKAKPISDEGSRMHLDALLWLVTTGNQWRNLPALFAKWNAVYQRFRRWTSDEVWDKAIEELTRSGQAGSRRAIDGALAVIALARQGAGRSRTVQTTPSTQRAEPSKLQGILHPPYPRPGEGRGDLYEQIVKAADEAFMRYGFSRTSIEDIARLGEISRTSIYRYFKNKEAILQEWTIRRSLAITQQVKVGIASVKNPMDKIVEALLIVAEVLARDRHGPHTLQGDTAENLVPPPEQSAEYNAVLMDRWGPILENAVAEGMLRTDLSTPRVVSWLVTLSIGLIHRMSTRNETRDALRRELRALLIEGLLVR